MKMYGLIGNPLSHSFSQKYFTEKFRAENITGCSYLNFEIKDLNKEIPQLKKDPRLCGLNVTIPYKSDVIAFLDEISEESREINACNCIKIYNGNWKGYNTDITGFERSFTPYLQPHHTKALVLGTGGSSKAVGYVLKKSGIEFLPVSRKRENAPGAIQYEDISRSLLQEFTIVINTTPAGMFPNVDGYPKIPYEFVSEKNYFFDLVYNPSRTLFLSRAGDRGALTRNGDQMLAIQAEESWKIWMS
ncbi:MAG: shikimate dehydrogenase [Ginsengibacter sp.]